MTPRPRAVPFSSSCVDRSGTTLLRYMLSSQSRLYIPPESDFIPTFFLRHPTGELSDKRIAAMTDIIFSATALSKSGRGHRPRWATWCSDASRAPAAAFLMRCTASMPQNGAGALGRQTPIYASYLDLIHEIWPRPSSCTSSAMGGMRRCRCWRI